MKTLLNTDDIKSFEIKKMSVKIHNLRKFSVWQLQ